MQVKQEGLTEICIPRGSGEKESPAIAKRKTFDSQSGMVWK